MCFVRIMRVFLILRYTPLNNAPYYVTSSNLGEAKQ